MNPPPAIAISEQQVLFALRESGRTASAAVLANWRREGLLPPLTSHGLGTGKGKSHFWHDLSVFAQAEAAFDLITRGHRTDEALWMLWLCGFPVAGTRLRRVWLHRVRMRKPWQPQPTHFATLSVDSEMHLHLEWMLLQTVCRIGATYPASARTIRVIEAAFGRVRRPNWTLMGEIPPLWGTLQMFASALSESTLLADARDVDLLDTQRYLARAATLLDAAADEDGAWRRWLADEVGVPLALFILALIRCGQHDLLNALQPGLEKHDRPGDARPVIASLRSA